MQKAIIVDIDGTISNAEHRVHYVQTTGRKNWVKFNEQSAFDQPYEWCVDLVKGMHAAGYTIIFLTARAGTEELKTMTRAWLDQHVGIDYTLLMRPDKDYRPDFIVKQEIYQSHVAPFYEVAFALDDKEAVCNMYKTMGIRIFHCDII